MQQQGRSLSWSSLPLLLFSIVFPSCSGNVSQPSPGTSPRCGNGATEASEECDDGNTVTEACAYGETSCQICDASCSLISGAVSGCGDGTLDEANEQCDDGNTDIELCDPGTGACQVCGPTCAWVEGECAPGYFGSRCAACACQNGGECDDGLTGTGACTCALGWSGAECQTSCPFNWSPPPQSPIPTFAFDAGLANHLWNDPTVRLENDVYRMWMTAGDVSDSPPMVRVYHASSTNGESWTIDSTPVLEPSAPGAWDDHATETPSVIVDGHGVYHLYYSGIANGAALGVMAIGHATSTDGLTWTKDPNNPVIDIVQPPESSDWGVFSAGEPGAVYLPHEDTIYLYYVSFGGSPDHTGDVAVLLATSTDGSTFQQHRDRDGNREPVWSLSGSYTPASLYRGISTPSAELGPDGAVYLTYDLVQDPSGFDQVGVARARSTDGVHFVEVEHDIAHWRTTPWTTSALQSPTMVAESDRLLLWFAGQGTLALPELWAGFDSGIARLVGTEACGRPTVVLSRSAGPGLLPGQGATVTASRSDPDGEATELHWEVTSATVSGVDCWAELGVTTGPDDTLTLTIPLAASDVRCADEILVSATVSDGKQSHSDATRFSVAAPPELGVVWTEDPDNPVINLPTCPTWDCVEQTDPTLGRAENGDLIVWYSSNGDQGGPVIGRSEAATGGSFAKNPNAPVMEPDNAGVPPAPLPWDYKRETVSVKWNAALGAWDMLYLGYQTDYFTDASIGLTLSADAAGTSFPRTPQPIYTPNRSNGWDASFLTSPAGVLGSDGVWRIYFVGASFSAGGSMKVGVLRSDDDGVTWQPGPPRGANPVFEGVGGQWDESILDCFVHFVSGRYMMWYTSFQAPFSIDSPFSIGLATSEDGYVWQRHPGNPIITPGEAGAWNDIKVLDGEVIIESDGSLTMAAYGSSSIPPNASFPDFKPNRIGLWHSAMP